MATDTVLQRSILGISQALFDATPGAQFYYFFSEVVTQGVSLPLLTMTLIKTPGFNSRYAYSDSLSTNEFALRFSDDLLGGRVSQTYKDAGAAFIADLINAGMSRNDAMSTAFTALLDTADDNPAWGAAAAYYKHEVIVKILDNLLGSSAAISGVKSAMVQLMVDTAATNGETIGDLVVDWVSVVDSVADTDPLYGDVAHRFHNKMDVSGYYSLNLMQSSASLTDLQSIIASVTADTLTAELARMKADYFTAHPPYAADALVVTSPVNISTIDTSVYHTLIIDAGGEQSLPRAAVTMKANQAAAFLTITKGANDKLAVIDSIANINAYAGNLSAADSVTGLVAVSTDLSAENLSHLSGLAVDGGTGSAVIATVTALQASVLYGLISKGDGGKLAVADSIANINAVLHLSMADVVTGIVSTSTDLSSTDLARLTDLTIGGGAPVSVTMSASQAKKLNDHITKTVGSTLTLICVPSEISTLPSLTDAFIVTAIISRDMRTLDLTKCIKMIINDGTAASVAVTLLAAQAQSLSGRVTKGMSDKLVVDDTPANVLAATDLSAADAIYATDLSGNTVTISEADLSRMTALRTAGETVLNDATSSGLPQDVAKISVAGGTLIVNAVSGNFTVSLATMATITSLTTQSGDSITLTDATSIGLSVIKRLFVSGGGQIKVVGAAGENLTISELELASVSSLVAAPNANIMLTEATAAGLSSDLAKLKVVGSGGLSVVGALDEDFLLPEGVLLSLKLLTVKGSGTIGISDVHNNKLADILSITTIIGTGSVEISGAPGENLLVSSALLAAEPITSVTVASNQYITLADANTASLATDTAKLHVSGTGKINIMGATGQSLSFAENELGSFGTVAATGAGNITLTDVTSANFASDLATVSLVSGTLIMLLSSGQALAVTHTQLLRSIQITAATGDSIWLNGTTGSSLAADLGKLHVSGGGTLDVTGALNENLSISAAGLTAVIGIHASGTGNITVTDASAANVNTLLNKLSITGTGTASLTFTDAATADVSATAANNRKIIASDSNGSITITNAAAKQTFYASAGTNGDTMLVTKTGDSTANTGTCDILNVIASGSTMISFAAISSDDLLWNVGVTAKATALNGTGLVLDLAKYDTYIATVGGSDYIVYETAVDGSAFEAVKIIGTVTPAALQMNAGILYL